MRFDLYSLIHKAQRKHLFNLAADIGQCNPANEIQCLSIIDRVHAMVELIEDHRNNEETFIHPLYIEAGIQNLVMDVEHHQLELHMQQLKELCLKKDITALYREFNRFIAAYLLHQDEEERQQELVLWKHFDDARLMGAMATFAASKSPQEMLAGFEFMAPALNIHELMRIFDPKPIPAHKDSNTEVPSQLGA